MAAYEGGQYVGRPSLRPVRGFFGSSGVPPGVGRNDEEDDVDVSPSEAEIFVAALVVARCCCRCCSCFFSARAAFFLLLTKCCSWCCAVVVVVVVVVVVANDISFILRVSFAMFFLWRRGEYLSTNARTISRLSAKRERSAGASGREKTQKRSSRKQTPKN